MARILVIDDNADLLQMIRMLLEERGKHEVVLSAEGQDGIEKALANRPDLAIIDVMMPGMTGYEVCKRLRQEPTTADMPIIILTARGQPVDRQAALDAGADEYMAKPVTMAKLLERVNSLLEEKGAPSAAPSAGTVAVLGLRGGTGTTTVAVNLAVTMARRAPDQVGLVDLCPSSGHVALQLGVRPEPNWAALARLTERPDETSIRQYLLSHPAKLHVLTAPFVPTVGEGLSREVTAATLSALRQNLGTVVIDLPSVLTLGAVTVLEAADIICLVTTADPPSIQTTLGVLQALKPWLPKMRLLLNQVASGTQPSADALQRVLKQPLAAAIPFDPAQAQALGQGRPLALSAPESPLARAIARFAAELMVAP